ncbi:helix-turn-helix domain-containing protein [Helcococcus kunzii]
MYYIDNRSIEKEEEEMLQNKIGKYIKHLRKCKGMTQKDLADKLSISFQTISKWENGDSLPDTSLLLDLANTLDTNVDILLNGGIVVRDNRKFMSVEDVILGFESIENVKKYFGEKSTFYIGMIEGINSKMNIDLEEYLANKESREVMITEVLVQHIMNGGKIDINEAEKYISSNKMIKILKEYIHKFEKEN